MCGIWRLRGQFRGFDDGLACPGKPPDMDERRVFPMVAMYPDAMFDAAPRTRSTKAFTLRTLLGVLGTLSLLAGCRSSSSEGVGEGSGGAALSGDEETDGDLRGLGAGDSRVLAFVSSDFTFSLKPEGDRVTIQASERSPLDGKHYAWNMFGETSYEVRAVCARHANEFYIFGTHGSRESVLERWEIQPPSPGGMYTTRPTSRAPIGIPATNYKTEVRFPETFVDPAQRPKPKLVRTALPSPITNQEVAEMEVDPDGRFLLFRVLGRSGASAILQYELATGSQTRIGDPTTDPQLAEAASMVFAHSTLEGRILCVRTSGGRYLLFLDAENDGVFEGRRFLDFGGIDRALPRDTVTWYP